MSSMCWLVFTDTESGEEVRSEKPVSTSYADSCLEKWQKLNKCPRIRLRFEPYHHDDGFSFWPDNGRGK